MTCVLYEAKPTAGAYLPCKPAVRVGSRLYSSATLERKGMRVLCPHGNANPRKRRAAACPGSRRTAFRIPMCIVSYGATARGATGEMCPGAILKTFFYDTRDSERIRHTEQDHARAPSVQAHLPTQEPSCSFHNWICGPRFCQDHSCSLPSWSRPCHDCHGYLAARSILEEHRYPTRAILGRKAPH